MSIILWLQALKPTTHGLPGFNLHRPALMRACMFTAAAKSVTPISKSTAMTGVMSKRRRACFTMTVTCSGETLRISVNPAKNALCSLLPKVSSE